METLKPYLVLQHESFLNTWQNCNGKMNIISGIQQERCYGVFNLQYFYCKVTFIFAALFDFQLHMRLLC